MAQRSLGWSGWWLTGPLTWLLAGCVSPASMDVSRLADYRAQSSLPQQVELVNVPFYPQDDFQCGPSSLAMVLSHAGILRSPQLLEDEVYLPQRQGSLQLEMLGATRRAGALPYVLQPQAQALVAELAAGHPVVVLQNLRFNALPLWHYAVVVGYDLNAGTMLLRSGDQKRQVMSVEDFDRSWARAQRWAFVALRTDTLPATARATDYVASAITLERVAPVQAQQAYQTALKAWPTHLPALMASGNASYRQHALADARAAYTQATLHHPQAGDAWNNLAQVLHEMGQTAAANEAALRAVALGGPHAQTYQNTLDNLRKTQKSTP